MNIPHRRETRGEPREAAESVIDERFADCLAAFVGGSVFRGEDTATSDLDMVIITDREGAPFRHSLRTHGWPVETFVHTRRSYRRFFAAEVERRRPTLATMCAEGLMLRDREGLGTRIREEAQALIDRGPPPPTAEEIEHSRYSVTDLIDDLTGVERLEEGVFIAHDLAVAAADLILLHNRRWTGIGKWAPRALRRFDDDLACRLESALLAYSRTGAKDDLIAFADAALAPVGGRLWDGYYAAARRDEEEEEQTS